MISSELAALQAAIQSGDMDRLDFPENCLDVVAQFLIGLVIINEIDIDEAFEIVSVHGIIVILSMMISSKFSICLKKSDEFGLIGKKTPMENEDILE